MLDRSVRASADEDGIWHRPYPSGGARYPVEVYLLVRRVEGLAPGAYYYDSRRHTLVVLLEEDVGDLTRVYCDTAVNEAHVVVVLCAAVYRSCLKYGGRGYRYAVLEAGAAAQCIDLACREQGLGAYWLGGFVDHALLELLDLSWELEMEAPIVCLAVGSP